MAFAQRQFLAGQRHIDGLGLQFVGDQALGQFGLLPLDGLFDLGPDLVGQLADDRPFFGGQFAHPPQDSGQLTLFAQVFHPGRFQFCFGRGMFHFCQSG